MKNIDKIRQMTADELAELLSNISCSDCPASVECNKYDHNSCYNTIKQWLDQESKKIDGRFKLEKFREWILDKDYPMGIDELIGCIIGLFEDDKEVEKVINNYISDFEEMFTCTQKFYKVKDLVDEQFYSESEE